MQVERLFIYMRQRALGRRDRCEKRGGRPAVEWGYGTRAGGLEEQDDIRIRTTRTRQPSPDALVKKIKYSLVSLSLNVNIAISRILAVIEEPSRLCPRGYGIAFFRVIYQF
ncbi:hypothetical protein EVAR_78597_1 [Eumeta japonica]|uniref:Uncharacterized protein n=1 Tax=Eumeta variegata TaxID=151549 RepID=A0A4C1U7V6_EUMVA|nr:hypothetical protein EVAR_78597_1 [Eumeta japonica]